MALSSRHSPFNWSSLPFLNVYPDERVREALEYAGHSPDDRVTVPIARDLWSERSRQSDPRWIHQFPRLKLRCHLEALNCRTGDTIARQQVEAGNK